MKTSLNVRRMELIRKGYVTVKELEEFLGVGRRRAGAVYDEISQEVIRGGNKVSSLGIRTVRVLEYLGLTEDDIRRYAADERKEVDTP